MTVGELRKLLVGLPEDMPVVVEVTHDDGDGFVGADLQLAAIESRCDEVERFYLWGDENEPQDPHEDA